MLKQYPVLINKDKGSAWGVSFVDIPGHILEDDLDTALAGCQEAFEAYMDDEDELPEPSTLEAVAESEGGRESMAVVVVPIDVSFFEDPTDKKTLSAKRSQWEAIDTAAEKAGVKRSAYMVTAAIEKAQEA